MPVALPKLKSTFLLFFRFPPVERYVVKFGLTLVAITLTLLGAYRFTSLRDKWVVTVLETLIVVVVSTLGCILPLTHVALWFDRLSKRDGQ